MNDWNTLEDWNKIDDWRLISNSPLNLMQEVKSDIHIPKKVYVHDSTLRDGEQFAGVVFNRDDKIKIGKALCECGVHRIELMPAVSDEDFEATSALNSMNLSSDIVAFCRSIKGDIQKAADSGCKAIEMEMTTFPRLLKAFGWSFADATGKMIEASHFAKEKGLRVTAFFMLITQAPLDFSEKFVKKVVSEGEVDAVAIPDTMGTCLPQAIYHFVRRVKKWTDKPVEIHAHNSFNMGAAAAIAGVMAGAEVVHTSINGLGEGGGNAPLEAVAVDLELMLGTALEIKLEKLHGLSLLVQELSGIPLQANWPLLGERVFDTESGIAVDAYWKMAVSGLNVPMDKDISVKIGRSRQVVLGKMSGTTSIEIKMMLLGIQKPEDVKVRQILELVKSRSVELRRTVNDEEFKKIVASVAGS